MLRELLHRWFAFRLTGGEDEIDIARPGDGSTHPEFAEWRWAPLDQLPQLIVPFKRDVYVEVARVFAGHARPTAG